MNNIDVKVMYDTYLTIGHAYIEEHATIWKNDNISERIKVILKKFLDIVYKKDRKAYIHFSYNQKDVCLNIEYPNLEAGIVTIRLTKGMETNILKIQKSKPAQIVKAVVDYLDEEASS